MFRQTTARRRTTVDVRETRGAKGMARHSSDVLDAIYMPDCVSDRQTPIAGENTASATMGAAVRRTDGRFSTNDRSRRERNRRCTSTAGLLVQRHCVDAPQRHVPHK